MLKTVREVEYGEQDTKGVNGRGALTKRSVSWRQEWLLPLYDERVWPYFIVLKVDDLVLKKGKRNAHSQRVAGREYRITEADLGEPGWVVDLIGTQFNAQVIWNNLVAMNREIFVQWNLVQHGRRMGRELRKEVPPKKITVKYPASLLR